MSGNRWATWVLAMLAVGAVALVHADPWQRPVGGPVYVTNHGATTRLVPELPDGVPSDLELTLVRPDGVATRIGTAPEHGGHWVWADGVSMGPADPDALDGLWSAVRGATTLRAADDDTEAALGQGGRIRVQSGAFAFEVVLGLGTPDGVGIYGALEGDTALWVVERQLADLPAQAAEAWVARRPLLVEIPEVAEIDFADATLVRGPDRLWRSTVGETRTLLSNTAVEARLGRLLGARLAPWRPPWIDAATAPAPWIRLRTEAGEMFALWHAPGCDDGRVAVDRGAGLAGCIDAQLVEPWPLPGRSASDPGWIEPRLAPHDFARVLRIEQRAPQSLTLRRDGGQWVIERRGDQGDELVSVGESEVFRWYTSLHTARLQTDTAVELPPDAVVLVITTDSTAQIRLRCGVHAPEMMACARDDQPAYVVSLDVELAFSDETFTDRQLAVLSAGEARAIELVGPAVVRQGAHLDLGVWRLDAPLHPEGDSALDELRLEGLLAAVSGVRAQQWAEAPQESPSRTIRVERVPTQGRAGAVVIEVWPGCIVRVDGGPAARVGDGVCRSLAQDLLVDAPLARAIEDARALEVRIDGRGIPLRRQDHRWLREDDEPLGDVGERMRRWSQWTTQALVPGAPVGRAEAELAVEPAAGEPYVIDVGPGWAQIRGQSWFYTLAEQREAPAVVTDDAGDPP